jgi:hypothetical protein
MKPWVVLILIVVLTLPATLLLAQDVPLPPSTSPDSFSSSDVVPAPANTVTIETVATLDTTSNAQSVHVVNDIAYVATSNGLELIDVSIPTNPTALGSFSFTSSDQSRDVQVIGNIAYLATLFGLQIIDVSDPANPTRIGNFNTTGNNQALHVVNNTVYLAASGRNFSSDGVLEIIDVSTSTSPFRLSLSSTGDNAYDVYVEDSTAYVITHDINGSLEIIDVSDPANPSSLGSFGGLRLPEAVQVLGDTAYLAASASAIDAKRTFQILDVSDPANPTRIGSLETEDVSAELEIVGSTAYLATRFGLELADVSDPSNPTALGSFEMSDGGAAVDVVGDLVYVDKAGFTSGLQLLRVSGATPDPLPSPVLNLNYSTGMPGSRFVLTGANFEGGSAITITVNGQNVETISTTADGTFTLVLVTDQNAQLGNYRVSIALSNSVAANGTSVTTRYILDDTAPLRQEQPEGATLIDVPISIAPIEERFLYLPLIKR